MSHRSHLAPTVIFGAVAVTLTIVAMVFFASGPVASAHAAPERLQAGMASYPPNPTPTPSPTPYREPDGPAPIVTGVDPDYSNNDVFTWISVHGANFRPNPRAWLGDAELVAVSRVNGNLVLAGVPQHLPAGAHDLRVCNTDGTCGVLIDGFTVIGVDPILHNVVPDQGYNDTPNDVTLHGYNLQQGLIVTIGDRLLEDLQWVDSTQVRGVVPVGMAAGAYDVVVRNPGNPNASVLENAYTVLDVASEDYSAGTDDLWVAPTTIRQGDMVQLGLNVHRRGGKSTQLVEVAFYRRDLTRTYHEIGRATTPPMPPGSHVVDTAYIWWDTTGVPEHVQIVAVIDPDAKLQETNRDNNRVARNFTLLPPVEDDTPPTINSLQVNGGAEQTTDPNVVVTIDASDNGGSGVVSMYLVEREFNSSAREWVAIQTTGWVDFQSPYNFQLTDRGGVRYIQAWVADGAGNVSEETVKARINYLPPMDYVQAGQVRVYRRYIQSGQTVTARLTVASGDADLYVWRPDGDQSWVSNHSGTETDQVTFVAPMSGQYQFEVFGYQASSYQLTIETGSTRSQDVIEMTYLAPDKSERTQPVIAPQNEPEGRSALPLAPITIAPSKTYLPTVTR